MPTVHNGSSAGFGVAVNPERERVRDPGSRPVAARPALRRPRPSVGRSRPDATAGRSLRRVPLILLADDSFDTREIYTQYLTSQGIGVVSASDGHGAVELATRLRPDAIIMDLAMPRLDGSGAIREIRANARTRRVPIIILTGYAFRAIQQGALESGADVFLTKPCLPEDLARHVRALLHENPAGRPSP